ncbi:MAG: murein biosynthesis integral membrane protein MurJ [Candidatus Buchananbacteria bacterium RIFCSPHIGHO2_02_FULL_56_16]|uniref:Probable lipid II flippase MurJ n=2 Tax=Candidatus Buchananiibacteriota TaxID=1817903 RepID=A0A1G1YCA0_9BACT|nr:MAG: murein biosynthesis integral membrane protein MurJ [Candidatus Buchananbacteria bacterium RIFCSPHIGHO2_02_FULL_56_16]
MIRKLLNGQTKTITAAAVIIGLASLVSRLLGVLRDRVLAGEFGAGPELDMYYAAFRIPDLVFNLIVLGALSAGFIPIFTSYLKNKKEAWELVNITTNVLTIALLLLTGLLLLLTPWLMKVITPGFGPEQLAVTTRLARIMFLSPILLGISAIWGSVLQSLKQFFIYSLAPIVYNVGIIIGALFFVPTLGVYGLAWGVVLGAGLHMLIQLPPVLYLGYRYHPAIDLQHRGFRKIMSMMLPRTLGLVTSQINFLVTTIIGSTLAAGSITVFNLANNLQSFPLGIFGISLAIAAFPTLSELTEKKKDFIRVFSATTRQILFFMIPTAALLIVLRAQIVRLVLGAGRFDWEDTVLTLQTLSLFAFSLFAQALILLLIRAFYAFGDSKTPFVTGLIAAFANVMLALMLVEPLGVRGLALAFSLASILNFILLWLMLYSRLGSLDGRKILRSTGKILIATFMLALVTQATKYLIEPLVGTETFLAVTTQAVLAALAGSATYLVIGWLLRLEELTYIIDSFRQKLLKKPPVIIESIENE